MTLLYISVWKTQFVCKGFRFSHATALSCQFDSDSFTILGVWVLGLTVSYINGSNCKLMSPERYFS